jgi:cytochrome c oxidase cbb3-type subunit I
MSSSATAADNDGVATAATHALGWLVMGNAVGLYLSILLLKPEWQLAPWTYGRWVPVHLNVQLYGWTAAPLVAWLVWMYEVDRSKAAAWAPAAVWAWTAALAMGVLSWLAGRTGGKIFLDWKDGTMWAFVAAQTILWVVLAVSWKERAAGWTKRKRHLSLVGLLGLAAVPATIVLASSPATYPPVDRLTGGPTGSSLLGSAMIVVALMLLLPRAVSCDGTGRAGRGTWAYFAFCWISFGVAEVVGGTHFDWWQNVSLLLMPPWAWLLARDWNGFSWPPESRLWRLATFGWWGLLVLTGYLMYFPWILDRIKFTQGLVAHSHLAMAGFTTSFCALLIVTLTGRGIGGRLSITIWHLAAVVMIATLAVMGWREGAGPSWMLGNPPWRELGLAIRSACGLAMFLVSGTWLYQWKTS